MSSDIRWKTFNPDAPRRVVVTKTLPGERWLGILAAAGCRIDVCQSDAILSVAQIKEAIGERCDGAIGQLTEPWGDELFAALAAAGGRAYSNYAVGFDNVDVPSASRHGIPVGNTPGVLTEATAEMAVALTMAAARRVVEADAFMRGGHYAGWLPGLLLGKRLCGATVGVVGAGRIGAAYARMMVEGFKMNLLFHDPVADDGLAAWAGAYSRFLEGRGEQPLACRRTGSVEELLAAADVVSLHMPLTPATRHMMDARRLGLMKPDAILVNTSRGPVVDEAALVQHCRANPDFRVGLDVFEDEPAMKPGLAELANAVIVPHVASATVWTRQGMAILAARNVAGVLERLPLASPDQEMDALLEADAPRVIPSIVNPEVLRGG